MSVFAVAYHVAARFAAEALVARQPVIEAPGFAVDRCAAACHHIVARAAFRADGFETVFSVNVYSHVAAALHGAGEVVGQRYVGGPVKRVYAAEKQHASESGVGGL